MEDRTEPGLWLELVTSQDSYEARADELTQHRDVTSAWWGDNANLGREDLPRTMPEFSTLAVYDVGRGFSPPPVAEGTTGLRFVRTSRPGQGVITGEPTTGIALVLISPKTPDGAAALRDWADFIHIRHIVEAAVPGYCMITPYESADLSNPRYLHLYEMDSADPETTFKSMRPLVEDRLGPPGTAKFDSWAWHKELRIAYVNTFSKIGAISPESK
jgi:hypothetical protein